jgi:uncharacterized repeat protein (TIGR01451 family)
VVTDAALSLTKALTSATPVLAGQDATFDLTASNAGPSDAVAVTVTDTLGANLSFVGYTGTGWTCAVSGQDVSCARSMIAAHTSAPAITLTTLVSAATPVTLPAGTATLVNTAVISSATPGTAANPAPVNVPVQAKADLTLAKNPKNGTATAGGTFTWNLVVHNHGPSDAASPVTVVDTLPGHQTFVSASGAWGCTTVPAPADPGDTQAVTCVLTAALAAGTDAPALNLVVAIDAGAPAGPETNSATASSPTPGADGFDTATVTVSRTAALSITKTHVGHGVIGADLDFTIGVHNSGSAVADQISVTDPLPSGLTYRGSAGTGWTCTETSGNVSCDLAGTLAVGADSPPLTITTSVASLAYPMVTNKATVASTDPDLPDTAEASDPVTVDPSALLQLTKRHVGSFTVGSNAAYRLTVSNSGPTETPGPVVITDTMPAGLGYRSFTGVGWTCAAAGATVTCTRPGALATGKSTDVVINVAVTAQAFPSLTNTATVTGIGSAPTNAVDTVAVNPLAVLSISKKVLAYKGDRADYGISVTNHGPNPTNATLTLTDRLPAGLSFVGVQSASGAWACDHTVTCVRTSSMPSGETDTFVLVSRVTAPAGTMIENVATVTGGSTAAVSATAALSAIAVSSALLPVGAGDTPSRSVPLARTGADLKLPLWAGLGLLLMGILLVATGRRRRRAV